MNISRLLDSRKLLILPPIAIGLLVLVVMAASKQPPVQTDRGEPKRTVRVIEVPLINLSPMAEGFGSVQPARVWTAVSQVAGNITYIHPKLRNGEILTEVVL